MRTTRAFKNGNSQAIRIPADMAYDRTDMDLEIEREGDEIRIRPARQSLSAVLTKLPKFSADLMSEGSVGKCITLPISTRPRITAARLKLVKPDGRLLNESEIIRAAIQAKINAVEAGTDQSEVTHRSKEKTAMRGMTITTKMNQDVKQAINTLADKNGGLLSVSEFIRQSVETYLVSNGF